MAGSDASRVEANHFKSTSLKHDCDPEYRKPDLIVANQESNAVSVLLNAITPFPAVSKLARQH